MFQALTRNLNVMDQWLNYCISSHDLIQCKTEQSRNKIGADTHLCASILRHEEDAPILKTEHNQLLRFNLRSWHSKKVQKMIREKNNNSKMFMTSWKKVLSARNDFFNIEVSASKWFQV